MASVKTILTSFCHRVNIPAPTSFVGSTNPAELQYLSLFRFIGDTLLNGPFLWPQLKRVYTFTVASGTTRYQWPGDFYKLLNCAQWDVSNHWPLFGPVSDYGMNLRQYSIVALQSRKAFRVIGPVNYTSTSTGATSSGTFELDPAPDNSSDQLAMGYISRNWLWPQPWVTGTPYVIGDVRSGDGYIYVATTNGNSGATRPNWSSGTQSDGTVSWTNSSLWYIPSYISNTHMTDNDECLFDSDLMAEGMRWAWKRAKGEDYQQERQDWEQSIRTAFSRWEGPTRISLVEPQGLEVPWPLSSEGSWNV